MLWPVPGYHTITSGFDDWRSYGPHAGFDIAAPAVPTIAVAGGLIIYTGWAGSAGRSVYINLDGDFRVHYCHLSRIDVGIGQRVEAGDVVGLVGGSGHGVDNYFGSHLHLNLFAPEQPAGEPSHWIAWVGMWAVDPELYLGVEPLEEEDEMRKLRFIKGPDPDEPEWVTDGIWKLGLSGEQIRTDLVNLDLAEPGTRPVAQETCDWLRDYPRDISFLTTKIDTVVTGGGGPSSGSFQGQWETG